MGYRSFSTLFEQALDRLSLFIFEELPQKNPEDRVSFFEHEVFLFFDTLSEKESVTFFLESFPFDLEAFLEKRFFSLEDAEFLWENVKSSREIQYLSSIIGV